MPPHLEHFSRYCGVAGVAMCSHSSMEWLRLVLLLALYHQEKCSSSRSRITPFHVDRVCLRLLVVTFDQLRRNRGQVAE